MAPYSKFNRIISNVAVKQFKVGDLVECIDSDDWTDRGKNLVKNNLYIVAEINIVDKHDNYNYSSIDVTDTRGRLTYSSVFAHRFKKVDYK